MRPTDPAAETVFRSITGPLLAWYAGNARILPWRMVHPDPYRTLISEIMLQQTRVETVKPYYEKFIHELPDIRALAEAEEQRLLKLWEGLGYYSRVRNLQKAAQAIMRNHDGKIPADREKLLKLPGIGEYTAGAIASIAFGLPEPAVDGNVLRVCARLLDDSEDPTDPDFRKQIRDQLRQVYPAGSCSEFTQSLMELGAMICLPGHPNCMDCPLKKYCLGFQAGTAPALPTRIKQSPRRIEIKTVFLIGSEQGRIALRKRPGKGVLANLWEYPWADGELTRHQVEEWLNKRELHSMEIRPAGNRKHVFTHLEWQMTGWEIRSTAESPEFIWATPQDLQSLYPLPTAFKGFKPPV